ncbi:nuclear transport factor 2 family protein [Granulicella sp. dw_53]|uniref:nuclear transport factor 2 family protein n=1 Tax=Granulicella sp. dw_53 TaxID=2719792 RepID=UPI001BD38E2D|nr:nuclear transport factor 2 family protein [Granulicella sp. dw_53]
MITDTEKNNVAQQFLTAIRNRDWELMRSIMTEDILWSLPGTSLISGEARGVEAVIERAQMIVNYGVTLALKHILLGQHNVALSLNNTARRGDLVLDEHLSIVCSLRDGKIRRLDTYLSDVDMLNTFFVKV